MCFNSLNVYLGELACSIVLGSWITLIFKKARLEEVCSRCCLTRFGWLFFQDSRVSIGALGRGRSPSQALNQVLRTEAPYILGKNIYPSSLHSPTWSIRADDPSRFTGVRPPRGLLPGWLLSLLRGVHPSDLSAELGEGLPRALNRWYVFGSFLLLRASTSSGKCKANIESSRCECSFAGPCDYSDQSTPDQTFGRLPDLATRRTAGLAGGVPSKRFPISPQRMVERIHQLAVHSREKSLGCCRNLEHDCPDLWMDETSAQPTLEHDSDLGQPAADSTSSAGASKSASWYAGCLHRLELAEDRDSFGSRLLWVATTYRALILETERCGAAYGTSRRRRDFPSNPQSKDQVSSSSSTTRQDRLLGSRHFCESLPATDPSVADYLVRLLCSFQT